MKSYRKRKKNPAIFNSVHCIEWWMSQGLFYNDILSRKIRAQAETYFLKNLLLTKMVCFAETFLLPLFIFFLAVPFGFILELPPSTLSLPLREVNLKTSCVLLPAALKLPLHRDASSVITAKPLSWLLPPQTSGHPDLWRVQNGARHCKATLSPVPPRDTGTHLNPIVRGFGASQLTGTPRWWHRRPGAAQAFQLEQRVLLLLRDWLPAQELSWRSIPPNPGVRSGMSCTEIRGFKQLSSPPACVNQHPYKALAGCALHGY